MGLDQQLSFNTARVLGPTDDVQMGFEKEDLHYNSVQKNGLQAGTKEGARLAL